MRWREHLGLIFISVLLTGDVATTEAAVTVGARVAGCDGILVDRAVIPRPSREVFKEFV